MGSLSGLSERVHGSSLRCKARAGRPTARGEETKELVEQLKAERGKAKRAEFR